MWGWIKKWFDPITTSKIFILSSHEVLPTLSSFIDPANIPRKYGGQLDFECGKPPQLDPSIRDFLNIHHEGDAKSESLFLTAPVRWVEGEDGDLVAMGVGSMDGKERRVKAATLHSHKDRSEHNHNKLRMNIPQTDGALTDAKMDITPVAPATDSTAGSSDASRNASTIPETDSMHEALKEANESPPTPSEPSTAEQPPISQMNSMHLNPPDHGAAMNGSATSHIELSKPDLERQTTVYMTPASDPSELKQLA